MASITLTIPDPIAQRVLNGFSYNTGYPDFIIEGGVSTPNPESKLVYAKRKLTEYIKQQVVDYEVTIAKATAADNTRATSEAEIEIT